MTRLHSTRDGQADRLHSISLSLSSSSSSYNISQYQHHRLSRSPYLCSRSFRVVLPIIRLIIGLFFLILLCLDVDVDVDFDVDDVLVLLLVDSIFVELFVCFVERY